jgi:hypothetical protein
MKKLLPFCLAGLLLLSSCDNNNDDQVKTVDKNGGIEVLLSTKHIDSAKDELTTHYRVWRRGNLVKEFDKKDTVQSLGSFYTDDEKPNGDSQELKVKADYTYFVTVK